MNKKIEKYDIVESINNERLIHRVNNMIESGWQPIGRAFATDRTLFQTMVRYEEDPTRDSARRYIKRAG